MANLTYAQLEGVWLQAAQGTKYATQAWAALMAAIAEAESGGDPNQTNPTDTNGQGGTQTSWGLWQISNGDHSQPAANWNNPLVNAQLAVGKLDSQGLGAWGTYQSGAYKAFISGSTTPDNSALTDATLLAATSSAAGAGASAAASAQSDCAWSLSWGGILGVGSFRFCLLSDSQIRGLAGVGLMVAGSLILLSGLAIVGVVAGAPILSAVSPAGRAGKLLGAGRGASRVAKTTSKAETELAA